MTGKSIPNLRLVSNNLDINSSVTEKQTFSVIKKTKDILEFPCQSDIEEVMLEKTEKILEEAYAEFSIKYGSDTLDIDHYLLSQLEEDLNFTQGIMIDVIDLVYQDCDLNINFEQESTVEHYVNEEYNSPEYKDKILYYLKELFIQNKTSHSVSFPSLQEMLSIQQIQGVKETVDEIIVERITWVQKIYSGKKLDNKISEIKKSTQELYEIGYISLYIILDMEKPYELIIDNNYMYSIIERMLDNQAVLIDVTDNIPD